MHHFKNSYLNEKIFITRELTHLFGNQCLPSWKENCKIFHHIFNTKIKIINKTFGLRLTKQNATALHEIQNRIKNLFEIQKTASPPFVSIFSIISIYM